MNEFKKDLACNITLISVLCLTVAHLTILILNLFGVMNMTLPEDFNYLWAFALIVISLGLYVFGFFIAKFKQVTFPSWLRIMFYVAFFVFTNTYYLFGLYNIIYTIVLLYAYVAFLVSVVSLSVFYNVQKDEKNRLKSSKNFIVTSVFLYSVAGSLLFLLLTTTIKTLAFAEAPLSTLSAIVAEGFVMLFVSIIMAICYSISLEKKKVFVNSCLVKYNSKSAIKQSVKEQI